MEKKWNLDTLYTSFKSTEFIGDIAQCKKLILTYNDFANNVSTKDTNLTYSLENYIALETSLHKITSKLYIYCQLVTSVNTKDREGLKYSDILEAMISDLSKAKTRIQKWIGAIDGIEDIIDLSILLKEYKFYFLEIKDNCKYILSEDEENIIAKMKNSGSNAWAKLRELLTSTLTVDIIINGEKQSLPLTVIRNMAYDKDSNLRKTAYMAELKAYEKIEDSIAGCLNGIKGEVITITKLRGYKSPLEETVLNSRMELKTLEVMIASMKESFPYFQKFFKRKGELLGYPIGLPFYELFAPIGEVDSKFTYEEAATYIENTFRSFSDKLADFARMAFEKEWIDAYPRDGKVGGAFCENIHVIGESRVMSNFGGTFNDVVTLAHELGHAYHGDCLNKEKTLNSDYPMPIAETASTFCETIIKKTAIKNANKKEALNILETDISDCAQVIIDIYSRFLFEKEVFEKRNVSSLSTEELKNIMLKAQMEAYGEGLDKNYLHPYMWICKPHYYYANSNFYNFPYAFGQLFSKGLYAKYIEEGKAFSIKYDKLLSITGKNSLKAIGEFVNIDINSKDFWESSLGVIKEDIDNFLTLSKDM
ncbi:MAG TPA: M3 family oligoendopeptidase [Clostridiaceae bacterium]